MNAKAKVLIPNKSWLVEDSGRKIGTLAKEKKGYSFFSKGTKTKLNEHEVNSKFGTDLFSETLNSKLGIEDLRTIYDFPCGGKAYNPVYNVRKKLPIYAKSAKSKSLFCAGYYIVKFRKGWVKSFCPKLITLERYPYVGPFKAESDLKTALLQVHKNETT